MKLVGCSNGESPTCVSRTKKLGLTTKDAIKKHETITKEIAKLGYTLDKVLNKYYIGKDDKKKYLGIYAGSIVLFFKSNTDIKSAILTIKRALKKYEPTIIPAGFFSKVLNMNSNGDPEPPDKKRFTEKMAILKEPLEKRLRDGPLDVDYLWSMTLNIVIKTNFAGKNTIPNVEKTVQIISYLEKLPSVEAVFVDSEETPKEKFLRKTKQMNPLSECRIRHIHHTINEILLNPFENPNDPCFEGQKWSLGMAGFAQGWQIIEDLSKECKIELKESK